MSDVVDFPPRKGRGGPPAKPPAAPQPSVVALIKKRFLQPDRRRREMTGGAFEIVTNGNVWHSPIDTRRRPSEQDVQRARELVKRLPPDDFILESERMFMDAVHIPATPLEVGMIAAWIVDSFPNRSDAAGKTFVDSMELVLEDSEEAFSAYTLAAVARHIIETKKFLPAISEVLSEARRLHRAFAEAEEITGVLWAMRDAAEYTLFRIGEGSGEKYGASDVLEAPF